MLNERESKTKQQTRDEYCQQRMMVYTKRFHLHFCFCFVFDKLHFWFFDLDILKQKLFPSPQSSNVIVPQISQATQFLNYFSFPLEVQKIGIRYCIVLRQGGLMVSALDSRSSSPGLSPGRGHCVVFLGKTLYSHSASLHPGV